MCSYTEEVRTQHLNEARRRVKEDHGLEPYGLQVKWRDEKVAFDWRECTAAILDALNNEGVVAWDGTQSASSPRCSRNRWPFGMRK